MRRKLVSFCAVALLLLLMPVYVGASPERSRGIQSAGPPQAAVHVVQRGETLFLIAERYGTTVDALAHANRLSDPTHIYVGQQLTIPTASSQVASQRATSYVVQAGDSLNWIARRHATTWRHLAEMNRLLSPDVLWPGQVIRVPAVDWTERTSSGLHIVKQGETLYRIALRYDVTPWALMAATDRWAYPRLLYPGLAVLVPGGGVSHLPVPFESVEIEPLPVTQGESLIIGVRTREPVTLTGSVFGRRVQFSELGGIYYGLVGVHVLTEPGLYQASLTGIDADERSTEITVDIVVEAGEYGYERIQASPSLLDPAVVAAEQARLDLLRPTFTEERKWTVPFASPCPGTISSYFGTRRAYNDGPYTSYHAGVDLRGSTGTPVHAPADGTVVLREEFAVRGNALVLDHGWGVLTGYWHLSQIDVEVGQEVERGDVIARVGNTGLSTGSHLHWEMWVGRVSVNPLQWLEAFYAWPEQEEQPDQGDLP